MLRLLGYQLRLFNDARPAARALLDEEAPDLLFIDMNMPAVTGLDLLIFVRGRARWNDMPIVMISAETSDVTVENALNHGADAYLFKPVTVRELREGVARALERHAPMAEQSF